MPKHNFALQKAQVVSTWQAQWKNHRDLLLPAPVRVELKRRFPAKWPVPSSPGCGAENHRPPRSPANLTPPEAEQSPERPREGAAPAGGRDWPGSDPGERGKSPEFSLFSGQGCGGTSLLEHEEHPCGLGGWGWGWALSALPGRGPGARHGAGGTNPALSRVPRAPASSRG